MIIVVFKVSQVHLITLQNYTLACLQPQSILEHFNMLVKENLCASKH